MKLLYSTFYIHVQYATNSTYDEAFSQISQKNCQIQSSERIDFVSCDSEKLAA